MGIATDLAVCDAPAPIQYQGYIDERSTRHVRGWMRNLADPEDRLAFEVVLPDAGGEWVLHSGIADSYNEVLVQVGVGDGGYAFHVEFEQPVTQAERERIFVRPAGSQHRLELAPMLKIDLPGAGRYQGYIDERSVAHIAGWVRDIDNPERRVEIEIVLAEPGGERVLQRLTADQFNEIVQKVGIGDGTYAFFTRFDSLLDEAQRDAVFVRPAGSTHRLEIAPNIGTAFEPIHHVAMDIVNNCNLRCPFCVYDYKDTNRTYFMSDETFDAALRLIPYVTDGNFWLSCLHEASLHPRLIEFIERVPKQYRRKLFFTTNLAKRMPASYFEALAASGMSHINISVESLDPVVYERMRKGARFRIFEENWKTVRGVFAGRTGAPRIRYNLMAYRSNMLEIPKLVETLLREKAGWQVEIRNTFDGPQIDPIFRNYEFLTTAEWAWLAEQLKHFSSDEVILLLPPEGRGYDRYQDSVPPPHPVQAVDAMPEITSGPVSRPFNLRISWDGTLNVYAEKPRLAGDPPTHANYLVSNINQLEDPMAVLFALE
jgi:hypothetical protein